MTNMDCLAGCILGEMLESHQVYCGGRLFGEDVVPVVPGAAAFLRGAGLWAHPWEAGPGGGRATA